MSQSIQDPKSGRSRLLGTAALGLSFLVLLGWAYGPTLALLHDRWAYDPRYAHGYLVPAFALFLLWRRRAVLAQAARTSPAQVWAGVGVLALGGLAMTLGAFLYNDWLVAMSLLVDLVGLAVFLWGWLGLRWAGPAIAFLIFMVPLPYRLEIALGWPLQRIAATTSAYLLQGVGLLAFAEGNVIVTEHGNLGVVEACSGLSMMMLFVALSVGVAILARRPALDRFLVILSAVPIALVVNILRITVTGVLGDLVGPEIAGAVYHDLAGWLMMPVALLLMWLELWVIDHLWVTLPPIEALAAGGPGPIRPVWPRP